jgi:molybdopterin converting factor small subunit
MTCQTLTIHLFANLKEKAGTNELKLDVPLHFTAGDL